MSSVPPEQHSVFTLGNELNYDRGLEQYGAKFFKSGRSGDYPGGSVVRTIQDAVRLLEESQHKDKFAIYVLDADWERDTVPSSDGWWHDLLRDARIVCKVRPENNL